MTLDIRPHEHGAILPVRAAAGAKENALRGVRNGALQVAVTQAAEKGKANQSIIALLSKTLGLKKSQLELLTGHTSRDKRFLIRGLTATQLRALILA